MKRILFCGLMILSGLAAAKDSVHPIDARLEKCIKKDSSTSGMNICTREAKDAWDKELNAQYARLKDLLSKQEFASLRTAQKAWMVFRDAQIQAYRDYYAGMEGTMWSNALAGDIMELTKKRALELKSLADIKEL